MFFAGVDFGGDAGLGERVADILGDARQEFFLIATSALQGFFDDAIATWV